MSTIRSLRVVLKDMRANDEIDRTTYRKLYNMAKVEHLEVNLT